MADTKKTGGAPEEKVQIIKLHHLRPAPGSKKAKTRVGRGEGSKGKTSGRGTKGTKARRQVRPGFEGGQMPLQRRLPKRGFKSLQAGRVAEVRLSDLQRLEATDIDLGVLKAAGIVSQLALSAKVILAGEIKRKVSLVGVGATKGARSAIEAAGGSVQDPVAEQAAA